MLSSYTHIGASHMHFEDIDSTNIYAQYLIAKSKPIDGTVISADYQTNGKGQFDRKWLADKGKNIIMSIILYPDFISVNEMSSLNFCISIAIIDYLKRYDDEFEIKWPNDIYHKHRKMGGILIQNQLQGHQLKSSVVGIGLNINQDSFPSDLRQEGVSLSMITGLSHDLADINNGLLKAIEKEYNEYKTKTNSKIGLLNKYNERLYAKHEIVLLKHENKKPIEVKMEGVDQFGRLVLRNEDELLSIAHGEGEIIYQ